MLVHHGAYDGVTGSCHQLFWNGKESSLLVDCGIFQGSDAKKHPNPEIEFSLQGIQCLLLTHVHIDHVGRLPYLLAAGFDEPIFCSVPTAKLLPMVMYELNGIFERVQKTEHHTLMKRVDVIVDSPLASRFTSLYKEMKEHWGEEAQVVLETDDQPLVFENLTTVGSHTEHMKTLDYVEKHELPAVVIAGSGMCTGGRVMNYLKRFIGDQRTDIVFAGYQAGGTPGNYIARGSDWVRLDGRKFDIAAEVHKLSGYSAHADQADLIRFVEEMKSPPHEIRLVHGDYGPKRKLTAELTKRGYTVTSE